MLGPHRSDIRTVLTLGVIGAIIGIIYTQVVYISQDNGEGNFLLGITTGAMIGIFVSSFETWVMGSHSSIIRSMPFYVAFVVRIIIHLLLIFTAIFIAQGLYSWITGDPLLLHAVREGDTFNDIMFSLLVVSLVVFTMQMRLFIGGRNLTNLMIGRYNKPRLEQRIFMIVDIVGSTALAQKLGDVAFHRYINSIFHLVDAPIHQNGGEIHSYVGDSVFAVWPVHERPEKNSRVLRALIEMDRAIEAHGPKIEKEFGVRRGVRAAIHLGPVVTGETGHRKRQITYLGNTVNLASRIESLTKSGIGHYLASREFMERASIPTEIKPQELGNHAVKGAADGIDITRLEIASND